MKLLSKIKKILTEKETVREEKEQLEQEFFSQDRMDYALNSKIVEKIDQEEALERKINKIKDEDIDAEIESMKKAIDELEYYKYRLRRERMFF